MKIEQITTFTWYATSPKHGELILAIPSCNSFRNSYIYSPRMIHERLPDKTNPAFTLELSLGPLGFISRRYYEEAGFMARTPFKIRMIALADSYKTLDDKTLQHFNSTLTCFILDEWEKVYKKQLT